jgi:hypothetical protein
VGSGDGVGFSTTGVLVVLVGAGVLVGRPVGLHALPNNDSIKIREARVDTRFARRLVADFLPPGKVWDVLNLGIFSSFANSFISTV